jgi:hypothetical protein
VLYIVVYFGDQERLTRDSVKEEHKIWPLDGAKPTAEYDRSCKEDFLNYPDAIPIVSMKDIVDAFPMTIAIWRFPILPHPFLDFEFLRRCFSQECKGIITVLKSRT